MRVLVLGGTRFLGRGVVDAALAAGDEVTTFTRGESGVPPAGVRALRGDRTSEADLAQLRGGEWDAVVDTSGYVPWQVGRVARLLADRVGHYVFVSSLNAYPGFPTEPIRADSPLHDCAPDAGPPDGEWDLELYGPYKAGCERAVEDAFPGRYTHVRAGGIVGPYDNSGRLPWWLRRIAAGGEVLAPGGPDTPLRVVDQRDLGAWCVHCGREGVAGGFPVTGPAGQATLGEVFEAARAATGSDASFTWVSEEFLVEQQVRGWVELPLWIPAGQAPATWDQDTSGAEAAGLVCRPIADTVKDTAAWLAGVDEIPVRAAAIADRPGLRPEREAELLAAWHDSAAPSSR